LDHGGVDNVSHFNRVLLLIAPLHIWLGVALPLVSIGGYLTFRLLSSDPRLFLPGETTSGHYQIEIACRACHTPFKGVSNAACLRCHADQLKAVHDSHSPGKFSDPRHAQGLSKLDARLCVTCHVEHRPATTRPGDVTQPADHCFHCHANVVQDRPSHREFGRNGCATAGCHNYHDNTALYEGFLMKHLGGPDTRLEPVLPRRDLRTRFKPRQNLEPLRAQDQDAPADVQFDPALVLDWEAGAHARAGVNCAGCHLIQTSATEPARWAVQPGREGCLDCHAEEVKGFLAGRHGMRLEQSLPPMSPTLARLPMKAEAGHRELSCVSCHAAHSFDTRRAAVESCLGCHNDEHTLAYKHSAHFKLWKAELGGEGAEGSGVSCATCHLPREHGASGGLEFVSVRHNQNSNLRPNTNMMRGVGLSCHGLEFSLAALNDPALLRNNFRGRPSQLVETLKMIERRLPEENDPKPPTQ
jgi:hypothetical protein